MCSVHFEECLIASNEFSLELLKQKWAVFEIFEWIKMVQSVNDMEYIESIIECSM